MNEEGLIRKDLVSPFQVGIVLTLTWKEVRLPTLSYCQVNTPRSALLIKHYFSASNISIFREYLPGLTQ